MIRAERRIPLGTSRTVLRRMGEIRCKRTNEIGKEIDIESPIQADMVQHGRWCVNVQPPGGKLTAVMSTVVLIGRLVRKLIALRLERDRSEQPLN